MLRTEGVDCGLLQAMYRSSIAVAVGRVVVGFARDFVVVFPFGTGGKGFKELKSLKNGK